MSPQQIGLKAEVVRKLKPGQAPDGTGWSLMDHAKALLPCQPDADPDQLADQAVRAWLKQSPRRVIGPNAKAKIAAFFQGAILQAQHMKGAGQ